MIEFNSIVLMSRAADAAPEAPLSQDQRFIELRENDADRISKAHRDYGRRGDPVRIHRRFQHGFRYFAIEQNERLVAWFWSVHAVPRYLDELRWQIPLDDSEVWVRDLFVAPANRRQGLMAAVLGRAWSMHDSSVSYFSDVDSSNRISLQAHRSLGFRELATVRSLSIGQRLTIRVRPPPHVPTLQAIRPSQRVLWLSRDEYAWHLSHIA